MTAEGKHKAPEGQDPAERSGPHPDSPSPDAWPSGFGDNAAGPALPSRAHWLSRLGTVTYLDAALLGLGAILVALVGQLIITPGEWPALNPDISASTRWYAAGVVMLIVGWWGTYTNRSLLRRGRQTADVPRRGWLPGINPVRGAMVAAACVWSGLALLVLRGDWSSEIGGLLWLGSLLLLVLACLREPGHAEATEAQEPAVSPGRLPMRIEAVIFAVILAVAFVMRMWRLGDLSPGMHGDEGEVGTDSLGILHGTATPLFGRGWFNQPNVYYWTVALFMKVFGTGLGGLRSFAVFCGLITVIFTYLLGREMFGQRGAIVAGSFMAFQSADLIFSRQEFSNAAIPALGAMAFYFALRGLRTRLHLDFVLAGFSAGWSLYYFAGGRIIPPIVAALFLYLAVLHPSFIGAYWTRVAAFLAALLGITAPFIGYYVAYPILGLQYPNDRFVWLHHADLALKYGSTDWKLILWRQLQATLSIITQRPDVSAMGALSYPIARPIEAVLIVLGLAWAAWRWRDTRFFVLSLWFWAAIIVGGVLTIDAPNLPRIMAMLPVLPLVMAGVLEHEVTLLGRVADSLSTWNRSLRRIRWAGPALVGAIAVFAFAQNWSMYIDYYLSTHQNPVVTGQAAYVQSQGTAYRYYGMGAPIVYWTHGDNRFINPHADGVDAGNLSAYLPIVDNGPGGVKPANFLVWPPAYGYLSVLRDYYPGGITRIIPLGDAEHVVQPLIGFVVPIREIRRHRVVTALYTDTSDTVTRRAEPRLGFLPGHGPPANLQYPGHVTWSGALVAPTYGRYRFVLHAPRGAVLTIDGVQARATSTGATTRTVTLARGPHAVRLTAALTSPGTGVDLQWAPPGARLQHVPARYLWDDHTGRGWLGEIRSTLGPIGTSTTTVDRRIDGFVGYRNGAQLFGPGPLVGRWTSVLEVRRAGPYNFKIGFTGGVSLRIDHRTFIQNSAPGTAPLTAEGPIVLSRGRHLLELSIHWPGPVDILECSWVPPAHSTAVMTSPELRPGGSGASTGSPSSIPG